MQIKNSTEQFSFFLQTFIQLKNTLKKFKKSEIVLLEWDFLNDVTTACANSETSQLIPARLTYIYDTNGNFLITRPQNNPIRWIHLSK